MKEQSPQYGAPSKVVLERALHNWEEFLRRRSIVPIYDKELPSGQVVQIGTASFIQVANQWYFLTARHCLYGAANTDDPFSKAVFWQGRLESLGNIATGVIGKVDNQDFVVIELKGRSANVTPFNIDALKTTSSGSVLTVGGFLSSRYRRHLQQGLLRPKPYVYTNVRSPAEPLHIALKYTSKKNASLRSAGPIRAPIPRGISGAPILDTLALAQGIPIIVGLLTDQTGGKAFGPASAQIRELIARMSAGAGGSR